MLLLIAPDCYSCFFRSHKIVINVVAASHVVCTRLLFMLLSVLFPLIPDCYLYLSACIRMLSVLS